MMELANKVTEDLEARGAKCVVEVGASVEGDKVSLWTEWIDVTFPNGRKWRIVEIVEE